MSFPCSEALQGQALRKQENSEVETHAVSVHEAISHIGDTRLSKQSFDVCRRWQSGHPALLMHCGILNNLYRQF
ncbi:MAG: hypothetical protein ACYCTB_07560 [bacterium]